MNKLTILFIGLLLLSGVTSFGQPSWTVTRSDFQYTASITAVCIINGVEQRDPNDIIAAFYNGECRGVGQLQYVSEIDKYVLFMAMYSNQAVGEQMTFKYYNRDIDLIHDVDNRIDFVVDMNLGSLENLYEISVEPVDNSTRLTIAAGWEQVIKGIDANIITVARGSTTLQLDAGLIPPTDNAGTVIGSYVIQYSNGTAVPIDATEVTEQMQVKVRAQDGSSHTYAIFIGNSDALLASLSVSVGTMAPSFSPNQIAYTVALPFGEPLPTIIATTNDPNASFNISQASSVPGTGAVVVTAEDGVTTNTYRLDFYYLPNTDASLNSLIVSGYSLTPGFNPETHNYYCTLPWQTTEIPTIEAIATDANAQINITPPNSLPGVWLADITAVDGSTKLSYQIEFLWAPNTDASLFNIEITGADLSPAFNPGVLVYTVEVPTGTLSFPDYNITTTDAAATYELNLPNQFPGNIEIVVTAADGANKSTYIIIVNWMGSTDASLHQIHINGVELSGFSNDIKSYNYTLPIGQGGIPVLSAVTNHSKATVEITQVNAIPGQAIVIVYAENYAYYNTFWINILLNDMDPTLNAVAINGINLAGFNSLITHYDVELPIGTSEAPVISATSSHPDAGISITQANSLKGISAVLVYSASGSQSKVYYFQFSVALAIEIAESSQFDWSLYPNPANHLLNLRLENTSGKSIDCQIITTLGQLIHQIPDIPPGQFNSTISVDHFPAGSYWVILKGDGISQKRLLLIQ